VIKKMLVFGLVALLMLTVFAGCSGNSESAHVGKHEILRDAVLGNNWQMYQVRLKLDPGSYFDIDLRDMVPGDKVDGYFFVEIGSTVTVDITSGANVIYHFESVNAIAGSTISDRFSFVTNLPLGTAHVLKFANSGTEKNISVFLEVIYPVTAKIRGPLDVK
jgi:hypothetical protein